MRTITGRLVTCDSKNCGVSEEGIIATIKMPEIIEKLERALDLILPLAKGYSARHLVGANQEYINYVEKVLAEFNMNFPAPYIPTNDPYIPTNDIKRITPEPSLAEDDLHWGRKENTASIGKAADTSVYTQKYCPCKDSSEVLNCETCGLPIKITEKQIDEISKISKSGIGYGGCRFKGTCHLSYPCNTCNYFIPGNSASFGKAADMIMPYHVPPITNDVRQIIPETPKEKIAIPNKLDCAKIYLCKVSPTIQEAVVTREYGLSELVNTINQIIDCVKQIVER